MIRRDMRSSWLCAALVTALLAGCAPVVRTPRPTTTERVVSTRRAVYEMPDHAVTVAQRHHEVDVSVNRRCAEQWFETVDETTTYEIRLRSNTWPWMFGLVGALSGGAGAVGIAVPELVLDPLEREDPDRRVGVQVLGGALVGLGGVLLTVMTVDLVRGAQNEEETTRSERPQGNATDASCTGIVEVTGARVDLVVGQASIFLGHTDASGTLTVDLRRVVPDDASSREGEILVDGVTRGSVNIGPVLDARDDETWARAAPESCVEQMTAETCAPLAGYLQTFPRGRHAAEARAVMASVRARRDAEREAERARREEELRQAREAEYAERQRRAEEERLRWEAERRAAQERADRERAAREARIACERTCRDSCRGIGGTCVTACFSARCD